MLTLFFIFTLAAATFQPECPQTRDDPSIFLWRVTDRLTAAKAFLFGTIHVPFTEVWDKVSPKMHEAFSTSTSAVFEVDLHSPSAVRRLIKCKLLKGKATADRYLDTDIYKRIEKYMLRFHEDLLTWAEREARFSPDAHQRAADIYDSVAGNWHRKRASWLLFTLYQLSESVLERASAPMLDVHLAQMALDDDKHIDSIETVHEQCNPLITVTDEQVKFAINYTLTYLEHSAGRRGTTLMGKKQRSIDSLVRHYRCGSLEKGVFASSGHAASDTDWAAPTGWRDTAKEIDAQLRRDIIETRNERMAERLADAIRTRPRERVFAALGTGHFLGEHSILHHLRSLGFQVDAVKEYEPLFPAHQPQLRFNSMWIREELSSVSSEERDDEEVDVSIELLSTSALPSLVLSLVIALMYNY